MSVIVSESVSQESTISIADRSKRSTRVGQRNWTPYQYLLWREWRNLRWWFPASLGLTLMIMVLFVLPLTGQPLELGDYLDFQKLLFLQSMFAPTIFLLGALAGCFANEREESGFEWCTTLPIHWAQSLVVKLLGTAIGAILCGVIGWYFAVFLEGWLPRPPFWNAERIAVYRAYSHPLPPVTYLANVSLVIYSLSLVCILVFRRVASGALAAVALSGLFISLLLSGGFESTHLWGDLQRGDFRRVLANPGLHGGILLVAAAGLYRWRWFAGMYANLSPVGRLSLPKTAEKKFADAWPLSWSAPNQQQVLFWLASKKAFQAWLWLPLAVVAIFVGHHARGQFFNAFSFLTPLGLLMLVLFTGLGSIWSFFGERGGESESFLAERGVSPTRYWWSRYLVAVVGSIVVLFGMMTLIWIVEQYMRNRSLPSFSWQEQLPVVATLILGVHALGLACLLAGQTIRTWQIAVFGVSVAAIVLAFLLDAAIRSSGYWGVGVCFGLVVSAAPLSRWMTRRVLVRWQPKLGWVFPTYATVVLLVIVLTIPWVRVWMLPPAATELAQARAIPAFTVLQLTTVDATSIQQANSEIQILRANSESVRQQLQRLESGLSLESIPEAERTWANIDDLRLCVRALGATTFTALQIGDGETAEVALRLRRKILDGLQPVTGLYGLDANQFEFFDNLERTSSPEALQILTELHRQQPTLLSGDTEQAHAVWNEAMKAQFSYLYRLPRGEWTSTLRQVGSAPTGSVAASDELLGQTALGRSFIERMNLVKVILPEAWWYSAEEARFQREIGYAYQIFLDYLRTDQLTMNSMPYDPEFGERNSQHNLLKQIEIWDNQRKAWARLLARMGQLPEKPESR